MAFDNIETSKEKRMKKKLKVLVVGASGGSGRKTIDALLAEGHEVTAFARSASLVFGGKLNCVDASVFDEDSLDKAVEGQDAVIVTLGISENPFLVRLKGPSKTPLSVRSEGTKRVIESMKKHKVDRLVVQTTYGSGPSKDKLGLVDQLFFSLLLKPQIEDTETQDKIVRQSGLNWTITQPVHLKDDGSEALELNTSYDSEVEQMQISRALVGFYNASSILDKSSIGKTVALSTKL